LVSMTGPVLSSFGYDAVGRRRTKTINGTTTSYLYDGLNPIQEQYAASVANLLTGLAIDEFYTRTDVTGVQTFFADALGSTVALTNAAAAVQATYTYEAFGATAVTGSTSNRYSYTAREDDGTGLKYYRARYYHPGRQRFISEDPLDTPLFNSCRLVRSFVALGQESAPKDQNLYVYVMNQPTVLTDPTGLGGPRRNTPWARVSGKMRERMSLRPSR
jgi:RHS repeat-associated protein